jgi:hypothetical protein
LDDFVLIYYAKWSKLKLFFGFEQETSPPLFYFDWTYDSILKRGQKLQLYLRYLRTTMVLVLFFKINYTSRT